MTQNWGTVQIVPVTRASQLRQFLDLPDRLYGRLGLPWVPPLRIHLRMMLGWQQPGKGLFLAIRDGRAVGRVAARVHRYRDQQALHFGFFECFPEEREAARALLEQARALAPGLPMRGPYHFRQEEFYTGLLVEGFEAPCFGVAYNPPYYRDYLEEAGFRSVQELLTYRLTWEGYRAGLVERRAEAAARQGIQVRPLDPRRRRADIEAAAAVMNEALKENWGFEEFTPADVQELWLLSWLFLDPRWLLLAEYNGRAVGVAILLPDYNPWLRASGGRLSLKLLGQFLFRKHTLTRIRGWALGVVPEARPLGVAPALLQGAISGLRQGGWQELEVSWVLSDNLLMNGMLAALGAHPCRRHLILER